MRVTGFLRRPSGAGSGRIRLLGPHPRQKISRLETRGGGVDLGGQQVGVTQGGRDTGTMPQVFRARLDDKEDEIHHSLNLDVSKGAIAKITGVSRRTLYNFIGTRGFKPSR